MALQQVVPQFVAAAQHAGELRGYPALRAPAKVGFRRGGDLRPVLEVLARSKSVVLDAPCGAGKTTVFPFALAEHEECLVVLVFPYEHMAVSADRYARVRGKASTLITRVEDSWPAVGVACVSAACVVSRWLAAGAVSMPDCYFLQDESHESGFASALVRSVACVAEGVRSYVSMSATHEPAAFRKAETLSVVKEMLYDPDSFSDPWSVEEKGAPWSAMGCVGNLLLFEDDPVRASELVQAYAYNGFRAFRLHAGMSATKIGFVLDLLWDETNTNLVALVADSSFRSGHTFPVSTVIDSGKVKRMVVVDGKPKFSSRDLYAFEVEQSKSRAGRLAGEDCVYWRPKFVPGSVMCELEQTDAEAFCVVSRYLGFRPPAHLADCKMVDADLPQDLSAALRSKEPLALQREKVGVVTKVDESSSVSYSAVGPAQLDDLRTVSAETAEDLLRSFASVPAQADVVYGEYMVAAGVAGYPDKCPSLPDGEASVRRMLLNDTTGTLCHYWPDDIKAVALVAMVASYNKALVEVRGIATALSLVKPFADRKNPTSLTRWSHVVAERMAMLSTVMHSAYTASVTIATDSFGLTVAEGVYSDLEQQPKDAAMRSFDQLPCVGGSSVEKVAGSIRQWMADSSVRGRVVPGQQSLMGSTVPPPFAGKQISGSPSLAGASAVGLSYLNPGGLVRMSDGRMAYTRPAKGSTKYG